MLRGEEAAAMRKILPMGDIQCQSQGPSETGLLALSMDFFLSR